MRNAWLVLLCVAVACGGDASDTAPGIAASPEDDPSAAPARARIASGWDRAAGPVLLVAGESPDDVMVVLPHVQGEVAVDTLDASAHVGDFATLLGRSGVVDTVALTAPADAGEGDACHPWPLLAAARTPSPWTIGFLGASIEALPLDSVQSLAPRDSGVLVSDVARLASGLAASGSVQDAAEFQGLPFAVRDARWFAMDSSRVLVAHVVRRVNREASPVEEHTLLVAERAGGAGPWRVAHTERVFGPEETVERDDVLAAIRIRGATALVLARDGGDGVSYALLVRTSDGRWRTTWRSAKPRC